MNDTERYYPGENYYKPEHSKGYYRSTNYYKPEDGPLCLIPDFYEHRPGTSTKIHRLSLSTPLGSVRIPLKMSSHVAMVLAPDDTTPEHCEHPRMLPCMIPVSQHSPGVFRIYARRIPKSDPMFVLTDFCLITEYEKDPLRDPLGRDVESFTAKVSYIGPSISEREQLESFQQEDLSLSVTPTRCVYGRVYLPDTREGAKAPYGFIVMEAAFPGYSATVSFQIDSTMFMRALHHVPVPECIDYHNGAYGYSPAADDARERLKQGEYGLSTLCCHWHSDAVVEAILSH